jgi:hypothetical protein
MASITKPLLKQMEDSLARTLSPWTTLHVGTRNNSNKQPTRYLRICLPSNSNDPLTIARPQK